MAIMTLYVGNLPWETTPRELQDIFGEYGEVREVRIITDSGNGRSKGFGFVAMPRESAEMAIARINGARLRGRPLTVAQAKE